MPGLANNEATLDEILEVRAEPLQEEEFWAILYEGVVVLKRILNKIDCNRLLLLASNLSTQAIILCLSGKIKFALMKPEKHSLSGAPSAKKIEKMLIYSFGLSLLTSTGCKDFSSTNNTLSAEIDSMFFTMLENKNHTSIDELIYISSQQIDGLMAETIIRKMAEEIVGPYGLEGDIIAPLILPIPEKLLENNSEHPFDPGPHEEETQDENVESENMESQHMDVVESIPPLHFSSEKGTIINLKSQSLTSLDHPPKEQHTLDSKQQTDAWSPSYSTPDFKALTELEVEKACDDTNLQIKLNEVLNKPPLNKQLTNAKSLPALTVPEISDFPKRISGFAKSSGSSFNSRASYGSSQVSLTYGAYRLDSEDDMHKFNHKRYGSNSSQDLGEIQPAKPQLNNMTEIGPEFFRIAVNPELAVVDISPPRLGPLAKGTRHVSVILPNSQKVQTTTQVTSKGKDLFDEVAFHVGVKEVLYFGLTQLQDNEHVFLDLDAKLSKYSPTGWKEQSSKKKKTEFVLYFKVKFFTAQPHKLRDSITSHLYYAQLRHDILCGTLHCVDEILIKLTGCALQAEYGDFLPHYHSTDYFDMDHYIPKRIQSNKTDLWHKVHLFHQSHYGKLAETAEREFLKEAKQLSDYGVYYHKVSRSKNVNTDFVWFGVCTKGVIVLEPKGSLRVTVHKQEWTTIKEFNFEKKKFAVHPKNIDLHPKMTFYTNHYRRSKYLFHLCQSFHRFYSFSCDGDESGNKHHDHNRDYNDVDSKVHVVHIVKKPKEGLGLTIVGGEDLQRPTQGIFIKHVKTKSVCGKNKTLQKGDKIISVNGYNLQTASHDEAVRVIKQAGCEIEFIIGKSLNDPKPLENVQLSQLIHRDEKGWESEEKERFDSKEMKKSGIEFADDMETDSNFSERPIDVVALPIPVAMEKSPGRNVRVNRVYVSRDSSEDEDASFRNTLRRSDAMEDLNMLSPDVTKETVTEIEVVLEKINGSYGISIMGGVESSLPLGGIFVRSLREGGPAHRTGRICEGDRILSVNGVSLEAVSHAKAVEILKRAPTQTTIVIDRGIVLPRTSFTVPLETLQAMNPKDNIFEVVIEKNDDGIGLSLIGGKDSDPAFNGMLMVKRVHPNKPAEFKIQIGDIILIVNDQIVEGMNLHEVLSVIRNSPSNVRIVAKRPDPDEIPSELFTKQSSGSSENLLKQLQSKEDFNGAGQVENGGKIAEELLEKMDFNARGSKRSSSDGGDDDGLVHDKMEMPAILPVLTSSPTSRKNLNESAVGFPRHHPSASHTSDVDQKHVQSTDAPKIESISKETKIDREDKPVEREMSPQLHSIPSSPMLKRLNAFAWSRLSSRESNPSKRNSISSGMGEIILVQLPKGERGLGITLASGKDLEEFVYIKKIVEGSIAAKNGRLKIGDRILSVNGKGAEDKSQKEIIAMFKTLSGIVTMEFFRPPETTSGHLSPVSPLFLPKPPEVAALREENELKGLSRNLPVEVGWDEDIAGMIIKPSEGESVYESPMKEVPPTGRSFSSRNSSRSGIPRYVSTSSTPVLAESDSTMESFIERRQFVYYTPSRLKKMIGAIKTKMENIDAEYATLRQTKITGSCDVGNRACNRGKNRNKSLLPYDTNRVVLHGSEQFDYINASHIKIPISEEHLQYIVTQAPLEDTVADFWRCVWENKVELIVMLTKEVENIKIRCHRYWPVSGEPRIRLLEKFEIELLYEENNRAFVYRQIQLKNAKMGKSVFVTQVVFTEWSENTLPEDFVSFFSFMKFLQTFKNASSTLVHCSTGVGRSAVFLVIDCIWNALENDLNFDVAKISGLAREQRIQFIQNKEQYLFCFRAAVELLTDLLSR